MKKLRCLCAVLGLSVLCSTTAYAQWEQTGTTWKYQTNGTYYNDGWHWIDGNNDNIAECYYFGADGIMLASCTTPDNYIVDMNGAWIVDGIVQTKSLADSTSSDDKNTPTTGGGSTSELDEAMKELFPGWDPDRQMIGGSGPIDDLYTN